MVVFVTEALCIHSNNDTFNCNCLVLLCCHILFKGENIVLRNSEIKGNGSCGSVACDNSSGELISKLLCCLFVNVDSPLVLTLNSLNKLVVNGPLNSVCESSYGNGCYYFKVVCCNAVEEKVISVEVLDERYSALCIILNLRCLRLGIRLGISLRICLRICLGICFSGLCNRISLNNCLVTCVCVTCLGATCLVVCT